LKDRYNTNLNIITNQIKQIENLVNEFSDFARMPKPLIKQNNIIKIIENNIRLLGKVNNNIKINFTNKTNKEIYFQCDSEQITRAIFNLIKNSIESINIKSQKIVDFKGLIDVEIDKRKDYIDIIILDNGIGFANLSNKDLIKPYYTTKKNGSGLGLAIVNKIIIDHNGSLKLSNTSNGAKIEIIFSN